MYRGVNMKLGYLMHIPKWKSTPQAVELISSSGYYLLYLQAFASNSNYLDMFLIHLGAEWLLMHLSYQMTSETQSSLLI